MNSDTGGQSSNDLQRQAAAQIARKKVLAAISSQAQKSAQDEASRLAQQEVVERQAARLAPGASAYEAPNNSHLKDEPLNPRINSESWRRYHTAWQDYYQKYYSEYYSNAAREYIAKERLKDAREQAEEDEIVYALARAGGRSDKRAGLKLSQHERTPRDDDDSVREMLRRRIRRSATDKAKETRRFRKFIPLLAGVAVTGIILFLQYNRLIFAPIMAYVSPGNAPATEIEALDPTITQVVSAEPRLIIPKLNIDVPVNFDVMADDVMDAMNSGVAHYSIAGASAVPGQIGNFIITGHSAGDVYSANPYKYIFSGLERLNDGDLIYVNYNSVRYTYQVTKKEVVEPTNVAALIVQTNKPLITLVTCTPLGTSRYRLLVTGEQISPVYDEAERAEDNISEGTPITEGTAELPANEPSFFERIWNFFTGQ